jgi:hypothetical protein
VTREGAPSKVERHPRSSGRSTTLCWKQSAVFRGERSIAFAIGLWSCGSRCTSGSLGLNHRDPPNLSVRTIDKISKYNLKCLSRIETMRIAEILFWNNEPTEKDRPDHQLGPPSRPFGDDMTNLANAFTRSGLVKRGWNFQGSGGQPYRPAPPDPGTELIPNGTLEPTTTFWRAEPVETEPPVGQRQ